MSWRMQNFLPLFMAYVCVRVHVCMRLFECAFSNIKIIVAGYIPFDFWMVADGAGSFAESFENRLGHLIFYTICFRTPAVP